MLAAWKNSLEGCDKVCQDNVKNESKINSMFYCIYDLCLEHWHYAHRL